MKLTNGDLILNVGDLDHIFVSAENLRSYLEDTTDEGETPILTAILGAMDEHFDDPSIIVDDFRENFDAPEASIEEALETEGTAAKLAVLGVKRIVLDLKDTACPFDACDVQHADPLQAE